MPWSIPGEPCNGWGLGLTQSVMEGPWLNEHYDKDKCIIETTKQGPVVNLILTVLTPNQPLVSHTKAETT